MSFRLVSIAVAALVLSPAAPAVAQLAAPVVVSPSGVVESTSQTYTWRARPGATWYQLWISDSVASPKLVEWYTAAQVGCADGNGMCTASLSVDLAEGHVAWWVRGYGAGGNGAWSAQTNIFVKRTPGAWSLSMPVELRFQLVLGGGAVLDRETGLVWQRVPSASATGFNNAHSTCHNLSIGNRLGWRIPTYPELTSIGQAGLGSALPAGHPFTVGTSASFWSQSFYGTGANFLVAHFGGASVSTTQQPPSDSYRVWCVRGATGADR